MNKPTNEGWFNHWKAYLLGTGNVTIKTGIEVKDILLRGNRVDRVVVHDVKTNKTSHITVDDVVCSMGVEAIADIVARNPHLKDVPTFGRIPELARIGRQTQLSIQLFLNTRIRYPTQQAPIAYLPDSPWALIIEDQTVVWENDHSTDPRIQSLLSVGICETDAPGIVYSKPFTRCTREEIRNEVVEQIRRSYTGSGIHLNDGTQFSNDNIVQFYLWDSFAYDERTMRMDTWEPKFSNNAGTLRLMPQTKTEIENLYFATGYTKTSRFLYSMEAAVEAGTRAANAVLRRAQPGTKPTRIHPMKRILGPFAPLVWMDRVLFRLGVPYLGTALASSVVLVGLYITLIITAIIVLIISLVIFL